MSYYIIIRGPLGIGKSTIAKHIAKELDAEYISIDEVLEKQQLDKVDEQEGHIPVRNFLQVGELVIPVIKEKLAKGKIVIFDGNFYLKEQIDQLTKQLGKKQYIFTLKAPLAICIKRDKQRKRVYGEGAATAVYNLVSRFDAGIIVNTENKTEKEVVQEILAQLPK